MPGSCITSMLTHWGQVTHKCVSRLTTIGSDNALSPDRRQAIIWTNAAILLIGPLGANFSEILIGIDTFSFKNMHLKISSGKRRPFCLGRNVLSHSYYPSPGIYLCRFSASQPWQHFFFHHILLSNSIRFGRTGCHRIDCDWMGFSLKYLISLYQFVELQSYTRYCQLS